MVAGVDGGGWRAPGLRDRLDVAASAPGTTTVRCRVRAPSQTGLPGRKRRDPSARCLSYGRMSHTVCAAHDGVYGVNPRGGRGRASSRGGGPGGSTSGDADQGVRRCQRPPFACPDALAKGGAHISRATTFQTHPALVASHTAMQRPGGCAPARPASDRGRGPNHIWSLRGALSSSFSGRVPCAVMGRQPPPPRKHHPPSVGGDHTTPHQRCAPVCCSGRPHWRTPRASAGHRHVTARREAGPPSTRTPKGAPPTRRARTTTQRPRPRVEVRNTVANGGPHGVAVHPVTCPWSGAKILGCEKNLNSCVPNHESREAPSGRALTVRAGDGAPGEIVGPAPWTLPLLDLDPTVGRETPPASLGRAALTCRVTTPASGARTPARFTGPPPATNRWPP